MAREPLEQRISVTLDRDVVEAIDEIATSFEDSFVSRGQVITMAVEYVLDDENRILEAFGPEATDEESTDQDEVEG